MSKRTLTLIHGIWLGSLWPTTRRFTEGLRDPRSAQAARLFRLLRDNEQSAYGRKHGFERIRTPLEYQRAVPIVDYDALAPWIDRIAAGEPGVLTTQPVRLMERSGGSAAATKLIPYTPALLDDFSAATNPWLLDLYRNTRGLIGTRSYWSLSPVAQRRQRTAGGVPIGIEDDTEYFGALGRMALRRMMAVPSEVVHAKDMASWRAQTLRHLLLAEDLGFISVWSPSFLSLLMTALSEQLDAHLANLPAPRREDILRGLDREGRITGEALWKRLRLISCWTDGLSAELLPELRRFFPRTPLQGKGLLATEGVISVPFGRGPGAVLAINSHFLEFIDLQAPDRTPLLVHELRAGGQYSPLLSTGGGLYRYHLKDAVECVGHEESTPRIRFLGKLDRTSDVCGEKLSAALVDGSLLRAQEELGMRCDFALLAPIWPAESRGPVHYCLFAESAARDEELARLAVALEDRLLDSHAFRYARELGQLGPIHIQRVRDGRARWQEILVAAGQRAGDIKPAHLDARRIWGETFGRGRPARETR